MKVLNAGDHPLSNADVLDWLKRKRAQHREEDAEDKSKGVKPAARPKNFMAALNRLERELDSGKYPYTKNPSVYQGPARKEKFQEFVIQVEGRIQDQLEAEWKDKLATMSKEQVDKDFAAEQEKRCLTQSEMLMIYNHAPTCVEMLQPMIENVEDRFTAEEQQLLVDVIVRTLRPEEPHLQQAT
ncbi:hypothetical protein AC578_8456 [Lecanosticta acicola]|uniref:DNA-directed RNA polymerase III subunit RPC9 n=1 Tax=Lecanosticta acicola TaxID=111012 RepID=A0AAI8W1S5_9PEZI|nr:hypothetical protein AC578_8456 [Lecanosticta acicola]